MNHFRALEREYRVLLSYVRVSILTKAVAHLQQSIQVIEITLELSMNPFVPGAEVVL